MSEPSVNSKFRLLGGIGASDKSSFPLPARAPAQAAAPPVSITPPPAPIQAEPIFLGDSADGADVLNAAELVQPLAQLCATPQVQTPFLAAIAGPSGAGKTFALRRLAQAILDTQRFVGGLRRRRAGAGRAGACRRRRAASRRRWRSPAPPTPPLIASPAASTIRRCSTKPAMPAAIRSAPRGRRPIVMTTW